MRRSLVAFAAAPALALGLALAPVSGTALPVGPQVGTVQVVVLRWDGSTWALVSATMILPVVVTEPAPPP